MMKKIKQANDSLTKVFYDISSKLYQSAEGAQGADPLKQDLKLVTATEDNKDEKVVDADYKVVDDDEDKK